MVVTTSLSMNTSKIFKAFWVRHCLSLKTLFILVLKQLRLYFIDADVDNTFPICYKFENSFDFIKVCHGCSIYKVGKLFMSEKCATPADCFTKTSRTSRHLHDNIAVIMLKYGTHDPVYGRESTKIRDCLSNCCGDRGAKRLCSSLVTKFKSVFQTSQQLCRLTNI